MTTPFASATEELIASLRACRDPVSGEAMARYMRYKFPFLGIPTPRRVKLERAAYSRLLRPSAHEVLSEAETLWTLPEREFQYVACGLLSRYAKTLAPDDLGRVRDFIVTKSWWDTVDTLAAHVVGTMVAGHPELRERMDEWISDDDLWVARTALLHQLRFKSATDAERLFRYCSLKSAHPDFFIRKAIGWALREYSKTDAAAVRAFVAAHEAELSPLSQRESLLWLNGGRKGTAGGA